MLFIEDAPLTMDWPAATAGPWFHPAAFSSACVHRRNGSRYRPLPRFARQSLNRPMPEARFRQYPFAQSVRIYMQQQSFGCSSNPLGFSPPDAVLLLQSGYWWLPPEPGALPKPRPGRGRIPQRHSVGRSPVSTTTENSTLPVCHALLATFL